jgi:hypothetical protein
MRFSVVQPGLRWCFTAVLWVSAPRTLAAQQFVADDAAIVAHGACQLEGWVGETASWLQPACQLIRGVELTVGLGSVAGDNGRTSQHVFQLKHLYRGIEAGSGGIGLVAGFGLDRGSQVAGGVTTTVFAYVPASMSLGGDRLVAHGNAGWRYASADREHTSTWAMRADVALPGVARRLIAIGELFGEGAGKPGYQAGVRATVVRDRLLVDLSWGDHTDRTERGPGWALGVAWTPPPFLRD